MAYQRAIAYQTLLEFTFANGKLVLTQDLSSENAQKRDTYAKEVLKREGGSNRTI